jgi:hypothetical protein
MPRERGRLQREHRLAVVDQEKMGEAQAILQRGGRR